MPGYYKFDYVIRNAEGEIVDSSAGGEALSFVEGDGSTIAGLENALVGKSTGDEFKATIGPDDAYGWSQRALIRTVTSDMFELDVDELKVGMVFQVGSGDSVEVIKVTEITEEGIVIDANHPLAGITFYFDIKVLEAREATSEEVELASNA
jgi:FKBP-type peptidyl-prolyl cis-trans isomerase SlyD